VSSAATGTVALLLPDDWFVINLEDDEARVAAVAEVVQRQLGAWDQLAGVREALRRDLEASTERAARGGGVLMAISVQAADTFPVPASVTVLRQPGTLVDGADAPIARAMLRHYEAGQTVDLASGDCGRVLRRTRTTRAFSELTGEAALEMLLADYWVEPVDGAGLFYLVFSSPLVSAREELMAVFDAIVASLRVLGPPEEAPSQGASPEGGSSV